MYLQPGEHFPRKCQNDHYHIFWRMEGDSYIIESALIERLLE